MKTTHAFLFRLAFSTGIATFAFSSAFSQSSPASSAADQNWPQWRGPLENGVAPLADPPVEWSETKNIKWKVKIPGEGSATPLVWENMIFVQTAIPAGKKEDGKEEKPGRKLKD